MSCRRAGCKGLKVPPGCFCTVIKLPVNETRRHVGLYILPQWSWVFLYFWVCLLFFLHFFLFSLRSAVWMTRGGKVREVHLPLLQAMDAAGFFVLCEDHSGQATATQWWWGVRDARHAAGWCQEVAGCCWEGESPVFAAKPIMNTSDEELQGGSRMAMVLAPWRCCHGGHREG